MRTALAAVLLFSAASAARSDTAAPAPAAGHLQVRQPVYDAGKVERGATLRHSFILRNAGKSALSIDAKPG